MPEFDQISDSSKVETVIFALSSSVLSETDDGRIRKDKRKDVLHLNLESNQQEVLNEGFHFNNSTTDEINSENPQAVIILLRYLCFDLQSAKYPFKLERKAV